jgi:hypothetical protein
MLARPRGADCRGSPTGIQFRRVRSTLSVIVVSIACWAPFLALVTSGCKPRDPVACTSMAAPSALVSGAAAFRVDLFDKGIDCAATVGATPVSSKLFSAGEAMKVEAPPGARAVVLTSYSDAAATMALGRACTLADLGEGQKVCLDLTLEGVAAIDAAMPIDASMPIDLAMPDLVTPSDLSCENTHMNGLGQSWKDCVALDTHTLAQATSARAASTLVSTSDFSTACGDTTPLLCRQTATTCACWGYDGAVSAQSGRVHLNNPVTENNNTCHCPSAGDPTWN